MLIQWLEDAIHDLHSLKEYIAEENPKAAAKIASRLLEATKHLSEQPHLGRPGRVPHTRELVITNTPFIIPYQVKNNRIEILRVFHTAMQWPTEP